MSIEATAEALAADEAQAPAAAEQAPEPSVTDELGAIWDAAQSDGTETPEEAPEEASEEPETVEAADSEADAEDEGGETDEGDTQAQEKPVDVPTDLPKAVRDAWGDIPEEARAAVLESHRKMGRQLADQGRMVQGIKPIQDVLVQAVKDLPALANMQPAQVAQEVMQLAKMSQDFSSRPVETMIGLIKQHRLEDAMREALSGDKPSNAALQNNQLQQEIQHLKRQLSQVSDPEYLRTQVQQFTTQTQVEQSVSDFAKNAEHWSDVEIHMPHAIQFVKASAPDASPSDVLAQAYDLAVRQFVPNANKAKLNGTADAKATPVADPEKTQAARKAKSVNVRSTSSGKSRELSDAEMMAKIYDKAMNS